jgi:hypothetical protein
MQALRSRSLKSRACTHAHARTSRAAPRARRPSCASARPQVPSQRRTFVQAIRSKRRLERSVARTGSRKAGKRVQALREAAFRGMEWWQGVSERVCLSLMCALYIVVCAVYIVART